ncbi:MAG: porin family protein [Cellvibrionales bacterium]|nr:porin family protein [Cellvibrionales bacterium]
MKKSLALCLSTLMSAFMLTPVYADDFLDDIDEGNDHTGWFVGGKVAKISAEFQDEGEPDKLDGDGTTIGLYFGYNFTEWFGLEFEYSYTGDAKKWLEENPFVTDAGFGGLRLQPKFTWQINDTTGLFFKPGVYSAAMVVERYEIYKFNARSSVTDTYSGVGYTLGLGAQFSVTEHLNLRAVYDFSSADLENDSDISNLTTEATISEFGVGLHYQF